MLTEHTKKVKQILGLDGNTPIPANVAKVVDKLEKYVLRTSGQTTIRREVLAAVIVMVEEMDTPPAEVQAPPAKSTVQMPKGK